MLTKGGFRHKTSGQVLNQENADAFGSPKKQITTAGKVLCLPGADLGTNPVDQELVRGCAPNRPKSFVLTGGGSRHKTRPRATASAQNRFWTLSLGTKPCLEVRARHKPSCPKLSSARQMKRKNGAHIGGNPCGQGPG